ncbi:LysR substrate-binding domain-containing protein [Xanthobacter tagetidis]|uniref:LysR family transcriptional regulator n=1 Tax=Xanthobacter tagetidis TaxID=60216 RepID=A0A3L7AG05_9HYPH|nr:LysR substrate-binding domain-containing protein [Xanthobacter tagetidis]MBB6308587.1 DNA-binding transcriptional LysR family regulator [Xanthobacter tagetidis]RLP78648.1 LysR family transcriptional regulator [Xanthobacter tagetidis]
MISHRQIEAFNALMSVGTTIKAAEILGVSQPAVSRLISQLESEIKLKLFDRERGRMQPTPEGRIFHQGVDRAFLSLRKLELIAQDIRTQSQGHLRIGALPSLGFSFIPDVVASFAKAEPRTIIKMDIISSVIVRDGIANDQFDIGFVADEVDLSGIISESFIAPPVVCVMPPGHPLASKSVIRPEDLADVPFISLSHVDRTRQRIDALFEKRGIHRNIVHETHFALSICQLAARGMGVGLTNPCSLGEVAPDDLVVRPFVPRLNFHALMIYPPDRQLSKTVKSFRKTTHGQIVSFIEKALERHKVMTDEEARSAIGMIAPPGPWIRKPRGYDD